METRELFYPQIRAGISPYTFTEGLELEVCSSKNNYFDWARLRFTEQYKPLVSLPRKAPALLELGYGGAFFLVFTGFVSQPYDEGDAANEITLKDGMLLLEETFVSGTFQDTTPQELLAYFLRQAGVEEIRLAAQAYPQKRQVSIRRMNVIQAINAVHALWGIRQTFFFSGGVFYWGETPAQKEQYQFEYGVNIINLTRAGGEWELETVSAPFVRHSDTIEVLHPQISGEFEVTKVFFYTNGAGFLRTRLTF